MSFLETLISGLQIDLGVWLFKEFVDNLNPAPKFLHTKAQFPLVAIIEGGIAFRLRIFFVFCKMFFVCFWCGPVLKSSLNLLQHCSWFMFWCFGHEACGVFSFPTRDWTLTFCAGRQSLNHRTTREVPHLSILTIFLESALADFSWFLEFFHFFSLRRTECVFLDSILPAQVPSL